MLFIGIIIGFLSASQPKIGFTIMFAACIFELLLKPLKMALRYLSLE